MLRNITKLLKDRLVYRELMQLIPNAFKPRILILFLAHHIGKFHTKLFYRGYLFYTELIKCFLRSLMNDDVILMLCKILLRIYIKNALHCSRFMGVFDQILYLCSRLHIPYYTLATPHFMALS